jgi:hypothetical protein
MLWAGGELLWRPGDAERDHSCGLPPIEGHARDKARVSGWNNHVSVKTAFVPRWTVILSGTAVDRETSSEGTAFSVGRFDTAVR